jgi:hypothetical protein
MKKIYMYLMFQIFIVGSLLFNSQCFSEEGLKPYTEMTQYHVFPEENLAYQEIYIDDCKMMHAAAKGFIVDMDQKNMNHAAILQHCQKSILGVVDDKIYLNHENLLIIKGRYLLVNDQQQWMPLNEVFKDNLGFYLLAQPLRCRNGHTGFKLVKGKWCCLDETCEYCCY